MSRVRVVLDRAGIGELLQGPEMAAMVNGAAERIAATARGSVKRGEVKVEPYTTDRAAAAVVVVGAYGVGDEAKYGALTGAAQSIGAEVKGVR